MHLNCLSALLRSMLLPLLAAAALAGTAQAQVGLAELQVAGQPVTLVYPTAAEGRPERQGPFERTVARDAVPLDGPRRLVVLSHGTAGSAVADHDLAATLARAGFVVAQPEHRGDNFRDFSRAGPVSWDSRPQEVLAVVDALAAHAQWSPRLRLDKVGVHGMSAGGGTALTLAGGRWRVLDLARHCQAHLDDDEGFCFNGLTSAEARAQRRAGYLRLRGVPDGMLPSELRAVHGGAVDPRIASVTVSVPVAAIFGADGLTGIGLPVGVVAAPADTLLRPAYHSDLVLRSCRSCVLLASLPTAHHMDLLSPWPADVATEVATRQGPGAVPAAGFDPAERQAAFERIAAFHRRYLAP